MTFEEIAKQQEIIDRTLQTYKDQFIKAEKMFAEKRAKIIQALLEEQKKEAAQLAHIGKGLEEIMNSSTQ